jgi:thiol:disulfide interchange protein DsbD
MQLLGSPFDFLIAFFGGILASLTPCVYPLIPVSAGYILGHAHYSKKRGLFLSLSYVTGISITYSFLGMLAVLTGSIFGKFSSNPVVNLVSGVIILIFGLAMLDLFNCNLTSGLKLPAIRKGSYLSALLFGLVSGLMISPCLTPILASILAYVSTTKNVFYAVFLLFFFSYGMGLIFILIGTFGVAFHGLPKPGKWMVTIKKIYASIIILSGVYFIFTAIRRF